MTVKSFIRFSLLSALLTARSVFAVDFTAELDKTSIGRDEAVSLKINLLTEKVGGGMVEPRFNAPDFIVINQYPSVYVESLFQNGKFTVRNRQTLTVVLRPKKTGNLAISDIHVDIGGTKYSAGTLHVNVGPGGQGTPPPRGYGQGSGNSGLRGAGKRPDGRVFFVRAQVNKDKLYKGEQIIVSYYLYRKARVFNLNVIQYPVFKGFLREDLELPIMTGNLTSEYVVVDGTSYEKVLLARYAAYPLKDGKMSIDTMTLRADVMLQNSPMDEEDLFQGFFKSMTPQTMTYRSDPVSLDVLPLPAEGRPKEFGGLVGQFDVMGSVDRLKLKANEAVTFTLKAQGRGNLSNLETPPLSLPAGLELFESKGATRTGQGGVNEKTFEYLLIPRYGGTYVIPPVAVSGFDPDKKAYVSKSTAPITLEAEGAPVPEGLKAGEESPAVGATASPSQGGGDSSTEASGPTALSGLKPASGASSAFSTWAGYALKALPFLLGAFLLVILYGMIRRLSAWLKSRRARKVNQDWALRFSKAQTEVRASMKSEPIAALSRMESVILDELQRKTGVPARAFSRGDLKRAIAELEIHYDDSFWEAFDGFFSKLDHARFAGSAVEESGAEFERFKELVRRIWEK